MQTFFNECQNTLLHSIDFRDQVSPVTSNLSKAFIFDRSVILVMSCAYFILS